MRVVTLVASSFYSFLQVCGGLLLHPYQTMQYVVEEKVFIWMTFLPIVIYGIAVATWWTALKLLFLSFPYIGLWAFSLIWISLYCAFWQFLLFYLLIRFWTTLR